jgi:D-3-phosphoglycerate dehydrogenase / 2-oxoglutarate reductase
MDEAVLCALCVFVVDSPSMKILIADKLSQQGIELLRREPGWHVDVNTTLSPAQLLAEIRTYDGLLVRSNTLVKADVIKAAEHLRVIGRAGTGVDNIDLEAATKKGIVVMNTPGGNSISVAEHTIALLLALARYLPQASSSAKQGKWEKKQFTGFELKDKTLGVLGLGRIGIEVVRRAKAFQMNLIVYDPFAADRLAKDLNVKMVSLDELLAGSDIITLHVPLVEATRNLINSQSIAKMKDGVYLINTARGELVQEDDLAAALNSGKVAAAALDVFGVEPPKPEHPLLKHPRVIATPHIAASTLEAQETVGVEIAEQVRSFLKDGIIRNAVNFPSVSFEEYQKLGPFLRLGESLGAFLSQISQGRMNEIGIRYYGETVDLNTTLVANAIIVGILKPILCEGVNVINARKILDERGILLIESRSNRVRSYANLISLRLKTHQREEWIEGTILSQDNLRLVSVDGIDIEAPLHGTILFIRNNDTPGVIGQIGTLLGNNRINIANFALGRSEGNHHAVGVVNVDSEISEQVLHEIHACPSILYARVVEL